jgi:hypothetical protein
MTWYLSRAVPAKTVLTEAACCRHDPSLFEVQGVQSGLRDQLLPVVVVALKSARSCHRLPAKKTIRRRRPCRESPAQHNRQQTHTHRQAVSQGQQAGQVQVRQDSAATERNGRASPESSNLGLLWQKAAATSDSPFPRSPHEAPLYRHDY